VDPASIECEDVRRRQQRLGEPNSNSVDTKGFADMDFATLIGKLYEADATLASHLELLREKQLN